MAGIKANYLLADRGYDAQYILEQAKQQGMEPVIPPRKNRQQQRGYDRHLYKLRHLVENAFLHLKQWRDLATRYAKNTRSFLAALHIRCLMIWSKIPRVFRNKHPRRKRTGYSSVPTLKTIPTDDHCVALYIPCLGSSHNFQSWFHHHACPRC